MNLSQCHDLTDISVIAECYHDLIDLDLSYCEDITDVGLSKIAECCHNIEFLNLTHCDISDVGIISLSVGCPCLLSLNLSYCDKITDSSITRLVEGCTILESLNLYDCRNITDKIKPNVKLINANICITNKYVYRQKINRQNIHNFKSFLFSTVLSESTTYIHRSEYSDKMYLHSTYKSHEIITYFHLHVSYLQLSCCINDLNFCIHYLCHKG
jgi:hypothetical protein